MRCLLALSALLGFTGITHAAVARPPSYPRYNGARETVHNHDGFLLRLAGGFGHGAFNIEDGFGIEAEVSGFSFLGGLALGGIVAPNLAVNVDFFGTGIISPSYEEDGRDFGRVSETNISASCFGIGITYYIMPLNLFLAGSLGFGITTIELEGDVFESDPGFAMNLMIGKEWWVADDWGVGVAAQLAYVNVPTVDDFYDAAYTAFGVVITGTYN